MEKEVIISIKGMQKYENAELDTIELVTWGRLERDGESFTLSYQESAVTGMDGTLTTFQIEPERVTLLRVGEYTSQMVFQEGRRHMSMYNTPYGTMSIGVNTRHLTAQVGESGGDTRSIMPSRSTTRWRDEMYFRSRSRRRHRAVA